MGHFHQTECKLDTAGFVGFKVGGGPRRGEGKSTVFCLVRVRFAFIPIICRDCVVYPLWHPSMAPNAVGPHREVARDYHSLLSRQPYDFLDADDQGDDRCADHRPTALIWLHGFPGVGLGGGGRAFSPHNTSSIKHRRPGHYFEKERPDRKFIERSLRLEVGASILVDNLILRPCLTAFCK